MEHSCGRCSLCCKILDIPALGKAEGEWCPHCEIGNGCTIYAERPDVCRDFSCRYIRDPELGEEWHPAKCHLVLSADMDGMRLIVYVDPKRPDAWKRQPYHAALHHSAAAMYPRGGQIIVKIGERAVVIVPDRDIDLGPCEPGDRVTCTPQFTPAGVRWSAVRVPANRV